MKNGKMIRGEMMKLESVNDLVFFATKYPNGKNVHYLCLGELFSLLNDIIRINQATKYIHIVPFYRSQYSNVTQEEFDFGNFYVECRDKVTDEEKENFAVESMYWIEPDSEYKLIQNYMTLQDMKRTHFLLENSDIIGFQNGVKSYMSFLIDRGIPQMMKWLKEICGLKDEYLPYGYFCFEIYSE